MSAGATNPPVELARYVAAGEQRILRGQRVDGVPRITDIPAEERGRRFLVERALETNAEVQAVVVDYLEQAVRWDAIPALTPWLEIARAA